MTVTRTSAALLLVGTLALPFGAKAACDGKTFCNEAGESGQWSTVEDWQDGYIEVVGVGTAPQRPNPVQMEAMASEAARVIAYTRMAEAINGVKVTAASEVRDLALSRQIAGTVVQAMLKGVTTVSSEVEWVQQAGQGSFPKGTVVLRLCFKNGSPHCRKYGNRAPGLYQQLEQQIRVEPEKTYAAAAPAAAPVAQPVAAVASQPVATAAPAPAPAPAAPQQVAKAEPAPKPAAPAPAPAQPVVPAKPYTGLILNLDDAYDYVPVLNPEVIDPEGATVYSAYQVDGKALVKYGPMQFANTVGNAKNLTPIGSNPLVVSVERVDGENRIVISAEDAEKITAASAVGENFLKQGRVALAYRS